MCGVLMVQVDGLVKVVGDELEQSWQIAGVVGTFDDVAEGGARVAGPPGCADRS